MSPSFPIRKNDPQIIHDLQGSVRDLRQATVEAADCKTFIVVGVVDVGLVIPPAFVADHTTMSGVIAKLGSGSATVELHAHQADSWAQSFALDGTWQVWWDQPWAELLQAGDPFWIKVTSVGASGAQDLSFGVVFGGESQNTGGNILGGGGIGGS